MSPGKNERRRGPLSLRWKQLTEEEKRRRIVDAVLQVIAKHGVQGTTTARIAAAAGVSEPTIYRSFRSRKDMLLAAADRVWQQRHDELESVETTDAMDHLRKICELHTVGIQKTRVVRYITELAVAPARDGLREHLRDQQLREAERFAAIVEEGKAQGVIRPDVDSWETAWRIMAVHWLEAMARLHGLEDQVLTGFSTRRFQSILDEIAVQPQPALRTGVEDGGQVGAELRDRAPEVSAGEEPSPREPQYAGR